MAGLAIGSVAIGAAALLVTASASGFSLGFKPTGSTQPGSVQASANLQQATSTSAVCTDFMTHLAGDLGKTQAQINAAVQKAIGETLADQVKNKQLTQPQADAIKAKLGKQQICSLANGIGNEKEGGSTHRASITMAQLEAAAAAALRITPAELKTDLAKGMSLSQIAAAQKPPVKEADFRARLIANLKPLLDAAVSNNKMTATDEQSILKKLQTGPIPYWDKAPHHKGSAPASSARTSNP